MAATGAELQSQMRRDEVEESSGKGKSEGASEVLEPVSLSHSDHSENVTSTDSDYGDSNDESAPDSAEGAIKCSAVHTLDRDMPDCDYSHLVAALRQRILEHAQQNAGHYAPADVQKCAQDDWYLSRFLLRHKLDLEAAFELLKAALRFNNEALAHFITPADFPAEFYEVGALLPHGVDRKGNKMLYMRVRRHKRTPEILGVVQAFIYSNLKRLDDEAQGRGIALVIDCSGAGLANADMEALFFIISTLKNYFPKGFSYFLVHNISWLLKPFWHIAKTWVPDEHRQLIKFSDAATVFEFIDRDNLPHFMGGQAEVRFEAPANCVKLEQAAKLWGVDKRTCLRVVNKFRDDLSPETIERIESHFRSLEQQQQLEEEEAQDGDSRKAGEELK